MRNTIWTLSRTGALSLALAVGAVALVATPSAANAGERLRGVTIDHVGVHFDFGPGHHYRHVEYPRARHYFSHNRHYRKAKAFERDRQRFEHRHGRRTHRRYSWHWRSHR